MSRVSVNRMKWSKCGDCGNQIAIGESYTFRPEAESGKKAQCMLCANGTPPPKPQAPPPPLPQIQPQTPPQAQPTDGDARTRATVRTVITAILDDEAESWKAEISANLLQKLEAKAHGIVAKIIEDGTKNILRLQRIDGTPVKLDLAHESMPRLIKRINARIITYVYGPAGTGKTHAALQACEACGIPESNVFLESCNPFYTPHNYLGYLNALGNYPESALYRFLKCAGRAALIADEYDRQRVDAPSVTNSLLAQGFMTFPNGERLFLTDEKIIIALGNTNMKGGNTAYAAASRQERSTVDRFTFLYWPIDEVLELTIARTQAEKHPGLADAWHGWIKSVRRYLERPENRSMEETSPTPRSTFDGLAQMIGCGESIEYAAEDTVFRGLSPDMKAKILSACPLPRV